MTGAAKTRWDVLADSVAVLRLIDVMLRDVDAGCPGAEPAPDPFGESTPADPATGTRPDPRIEGVRAELHRLSIALRRARTALAGEPEPAALPEAAGTGASADAPKLGLRRASGVLLELEERLDATARLLALDPEPGPGRTAELGSGAPESIR